jgi:beta-lysine 5,6-aminomutase alpha subunit
VELLERIVDDGLLNAIGDGTFGLMKRPQDAGRGLEGVARRSSQYYNPAIELLEEDR